MPVSILIADDHAIVIQGTALLIRQVLPDAIILHAKSYKEIVNRLQEAPVHLLICDVNMPGTNGFNMIAPIKVIQKNIKILIFSAYNEELYALRYIKAGAHGYLQKDTDEEVIQQAILKVLQEGRYVSEAIYNKLQTQSSAGDESIENPLDKLSNREMEIANLLIRGLGFSEICAALNLQGPTVSTYKKRLFEKLEVTNVPELVVVFHNYDNNQPVMEPEL